MTRDQKTYRLAYWLASALIALALLSGFYKILYPVDFAQAVHRFHLLPSVLVNPAALYLPWLEMVCAICLLFIPRYRVAALSIVLALLVLFTGGIAINLWRGASIDCGCFSGSMDRPITWLHVARNLGLVLLAVLALVAKQRASR